MIDRRQASTTFLFLLVPVLAVQTLFALAPFAAAHATSFASLFGGNYHQPAVTDPALGDDVVGEMLHFTAVAAERRYLHASIVVEMNMQCRQRHTMMTMEVLHQPAGKIACGMIVNVDQRRNAFTTGTCVVRRLLHSCTGKITDRFRAILVATFLDHAIEICHQVVVERHGHALHCGLPISTAQMEV